MTEIGTSRLALRSTGHFSPCCSSVAVSQSGNARRGYAACALTDVLHAQFGLALARLRAGELGYANEVEDVLRKVPEQRRQISELEDR